MPENERVLKDSPQESSEDWTHKILATLKKSSRQWEVQMVSAPGQSVMPRAEISRVTKMLTLVWNRALATYRQGIMLAQRRKTEAEVQAREAEAEAAQKASSSSTMKEKV